MCAVILDTNVLQDIITGAYSREDVYFIKDYENYITIITLAEILTGMKLAGVEDKTIQYQMNLIKSSVGIIGIDEKTAYQYSDYVCKHIDKAKENYNDVWITAICESTGFDFCTRNPKDFVSLRMLNKTTVEGYTASFTSNQNSQATSIEY